MLDRTTITPRSYSALSDAAQEVMRLSLRAEAVELGAFAAIDFLPRDDRIAPHRPFLYRGDWLDDGRGNLWTVLTALLHEDDEDDGTPYLWHEYEVVNGMRVIR